MVYTSALPRCPQPVRCRGFRPVRRDPDAYEPCEVVFAGVDGAGKGETVNLLNAWMDPRYLVTRACGEPSDEARERPEYWRYWRDLPPNGRIGFFLKLVVLTAGARARPAAFHRR
jgi:hypothetical protein